MPEMLEKGTVVPQPSHLEAGNQGRAGLLYALSAYAVWGFIPLYFHALSRVRPITILYHRIIWSALFLAVVVSARAEWKFIWPVLRSRRNLLMLSAGAILIALNWLLFIYAVATRQLLQASLGYFINPLLSIALGMIFLKERLRRWQWLAVAIAGGAVINLGLRGAGFPWLALSLAGSFGFYGLVRKAIDLNSLHGLMIESALLLPVAAFMLMVGSSVRLALPTLGVLSLSGVITAVPLLCFGAALRRLQLSTMGFLQYLGPTLQFLVATCIFRESLSLSKLGSFALCWLAIAVYVVDSILNRSAQPVADEPE
ncbi:MAG TPA: EamA family transporter RarD [Patescibacteria group bacterium]|jgi:chloramphenicol-sensitive protein RarD|nr:EamA family transporter RarD [Patescibacteria group bacterium]